MFKIGRFLLISAFERDKSRKPRSYEEDNGIFFFLKTSKTKQKTRNKMWILEPACQSSLIFTTILSF